jgi:glycosyltransferase involved in cell wall biosynthesis
MAKRTIMLLSDDLRMSSGVGTMSREIVLGTLQHYNWVQIGGAIKHPEAGKIVDMSESVREETGVEDAELTIYPTSGYGNQEIVRDLIVRHQVDALLIYTDPRFWGWLFQMEHEVRQHIPIFYYNIWDDLPYPMYNRNFYDSVDLLMNISRQTVNIVKNVRTEYEDWQVTYVPHGCNTESFYPITSLHEEWGELKSFRAGLADKDIEFIVLYNSRNIRRKVPGDVVLAYKTFCDMLPKEDADKCALVMHTQPVDENGTDLPELVKAVAPDVKVYFSDSKLDNKHMNFLYNMADVTINIASNEGWGLSTTESLLTETPIIVNVTGGLQDQCGFKKEDGSYITVDDYTTEWGSNHDGRYKECGEWAKPVFPSSISLVGSIPTPYIFDDRCRWDDAADKIKEWYDVGDDERKRCGELGKEYAFSEKAGMTAEMMCQNFIDKMDTAFDKWTPRNRYEIVKV